jgi:O-antigen ligase
MSTAALAARSILAPTPTAPSRAAASLQRFTAAVAWGCVGSYVVRATLLPGVCGPRFERLFALAPLGALLAAAAYALLGGAGRLDGRCVLLVAGAAASLWGSEMLDSAVPRWIGWAVLLVAVGPLVNTRHAWALRRTAFEAALKLFTAATLASAAWRAAGMPHLGVGDFSGVLGHSMTLGPIAAIAGLVGLVDGIARRSRAGYALFAISGLVAMLASSRAALAGLAAGALVALTLSWKRRPLASLAMVAAALVLGAVPEAALDGLSVVLPEQLVAGLSRKNWEHTRQGHWQARWDEFQSSPWNGIGFGAGWDGSIGFNDETGAVETGSSYLALLSMTGLVGTAGFLLMVVPLARGVHRHWRLLDERFRLQAAALAAFWAVHLGAEGYVYAVGSVFALTFWLWIATVNDQLQQVAPRAAAAPTQRGALPRSQFLPPPVTP